jgi:hypothetical protein
MRGDARSRRVVVVPDAALNPPDGDTAAVDALVAAGWGLVVLPPPGLDAADEAAVLAAIGDGLTEFAAAGYDLATTAAPGEVAVLEAALGCRLPPPDG